MSRSSAGFFALGLGTAFAGSLLLVRNSDISAVSLLVLPIAAACALWVIRSPFLGLLALAFLTQIDALAALLFAWAPVSGIEILAGLTFAGFVLSNERYHNTAHHPVADNTAIKLLILFAIAVLLSALFANDTAASIDALGNFASVCILVFLIMALANSEQRLKYLLYAIMGSTLVSGLFVIGDWVAGSQLLPDIEGAAISTWENVYRSSGASKEAPTLAASMLLAGTTLALILAAREPRTRVLTVPTVAFGTMAIFFTLTRHTTATYFIMLLWFLLKFRKNYSFALMTVIFGLVVIATLQVLPGALGDRFEILLDPGQDRTVLRRISYHVIGLDLLSTNGFFGIGIGNFPGAFSDFEYRWVPGRTASDRPLHNIYLQVAVEVGILGFVLFISLLLLCLQNLGALRRHCTSQSLQTVSEALQFSFVSILIQAAFLSSTFNKYLWFFIGMTLALSRIAVRSSVSQMPTKSVAPLPDANVLESSKARANP